jgi:hypothetical protein
MENEIQSNESCCKNWRSPNIILIFIGMILVAGVVIIALIREKIVNPNLNQVTVNGEGKVSYQPDIAAVTLGVQVDKAVTAEVALKQLNEKINKAIDELGTIGISKENIKTKNYSLNPQYDYRDGTSTISGYSANQQLEIKVEGIDKNIELVGNVISAASRVGINQVSGVSFDVASLNDLKQQARIKAIEDARGKANSLAKAAGVKRLKKVIGWYENVVKSPDMQNGDYGYGGMGEKALSSVSSAPAQVPSGTQEIIINVGVNYQVD